MGQKVLMLSIFILCIWKIAHSFTIKKLDLIDLGNGTYLVSASFESFPTQDILLALKRQRGEVVILYEFELRSINPPEEKIIQKEIYFQKASYNPETNVYYLEDNFGTIQFLRAEDIIPYLVFLNSYPLRIGKYSKQEMSEKILALKVTISFYTHLDKNLRYSRVEKRRQYQTSREYVIH